MAEIGRNCTEGARIEFPNLVASTNGKGGAGEAGRVIGTIDTTKCAGDIADGNGSTKGSANDGRDYKEV